MSDPRRHVAGNRGTAIAAGDCVALVEAPPDAIIVKVFEHVMFEQGSVPLLIEKLVAFGISALPAFAFIATEGAGVHVLARGSAVVNIQQDETDSTRVDGSGMTLWREELVDRYQGAVLSLGRAPELSAQWVTYGVVAAGAISVGVFVPDHGSVRTGPTGSAVELLAPLDDPVPPVADLKEDDVEIEADTDVEIEADTGDEIDTGAEDDPEPPVPNDEAGVGELVDEPDLSSSHEEAPDPIAVTDDEAHEPPPQIEPSPEPPEPDRPSRPGPVPSSGDGGASFAAVPSGNDGVPTDGDASDLDFGNLLHHTQYRRPEDAAVRSTDDSAGDGSPSAKPEEAPPTGGVGSGDPLQQSGETLMYQEAGQTSGAIADDPDHDGHTEIRRLSVPARTTTSPTGGLLQAVTCPASHFNPPEAMHCRVCGQAIEDRSTKQIERRSLGLLRLSDNREVRLEAPVVFGRRPSSTPINGQIPHVVVIDNSEFSRFHAMVTVDGWQVYVTDQGSTNGTSVTAPNLPPVACQPLAPTLVPAGSVVDLGGVVTFRYDAE